MLALLIAALLLVPAEAAEPDEESIHYNFDVKRVSDTILALWMYDAATPDHLPFILFLEGEENWYKGRTRTSREKSESALKLEYVAGKGRISLEYNPEDTELSLFGRVYDLSVANVFVVRGFTGYAGEPAVKGIVAWEIVCPEKMNPAEYVLSRMRKEGLAN